MTNSPEPIVWLNGQVVSFSQASLSITDLGVVLGASVTEMIRTFRHEPFRLDRHLDRLFQSLDAVGIGEDVDRDQLRKTVNDVVSHNCRLIADDHDLGIVIFVTAGHNLTYLGPAAAERARTPTVCVHTFPLPFGLWAEKLGRGQHLITPGVRPVPADSVDPRIKCRSRMHWYLADREARLSDSYASALLVDAAGLITETSTANFFIVTDGEIRTPGQNVLLGVSAMVVEELAGQLKIPFRRCHLTPADVAKADEAFTSSTPYCLLPVARYNGQPLGTGTREVVGRLLTAWSTLVGTDVAEQIRSGSGTEVR